MRLVHTAPHRENPGGHAQVPARQNDAPTQTLPQRPQLFGLLLVFTQMPPQFVVPARHPHTPSMHVDPPKHTLPHRPQCRLLNCVLTHVPSHWVNPPKQLG